MRPVEELERQIEALQRFRQALLDYLDTLEFAQHSTGSLHWRVSEGQEERSVAARHRVDLTAGAAQLAVERADTFRELPVIRAVEPHSWSSAFRGASRYGVDELLGAVDQSQGALTAELEVARTREQGLLGLVGLGARFLSLPTTIREAAGLPPKSVGGRLAQGVGILIQILIGLLVTTVGTVAAIWIGSRVGL